MGVPTDRKEDAPDGYKEHIEWTAGGDNVNTPDEVKYEIKDVVKKAKVDAEEAEHVKITWPDQAPPKPPKPEPIQGVYKSNLTGEVPPFMYPRAGASANDNVTTPITAQVGQRHHHGHHKRHQKHHHHSQKPMSLAAGMTYPARHVNNSVVESIVVKNKIGAEAWTMDMYDKTNDDDYKSAVPKGIAVNYQAASAPSTANSSSASNATSGADDATSSNSSSSASTAANATATDTAAANTSADASANTTAGAAADAGADAAAASNATSFAQQQVACEPPL
jgi:hypothetical protein